MALQEKVLAGRPDDLNFVSGTYMVEGEDHLSQGKLYTFAGGKDDHTYITRTNKQTNK